MGIKKSTMHETHKRWLKELNDELLLTYSEILNDQANGNKNSFGFDSELLNEWGADSVDAFLNGCRDLYAEKNTGQRMWFYCWFNQQSSQIAMGAIFQRHGNLPFDCELRLCELQTVVRGLFNSDSGLFTRAKLDVWQSPI